MQRLAWVAWVGLWLMACSNDWPVKRDPRSEIELRVSALGGTPNANAAQAGLPHSQSSAANSLADFPGPIRYERYEQPDSVVHVVRIPDPDAVDIQVSLVDGLATVEQQARDAEAIAAINAGFFDPQNQQTTSVVTIDGAIAANPRDNPRLMDNPDLAPYLDAILNRSEFRQLRCGEHLTYHIAYHADPIHLMGDRPPTFLRQNPTAQYSEHSTCTLEQAVGGGPRLLPRLQSVEEGFVAYGAEGAVVRDAIGSLSPNARSAVGMTDTGAIVLVMVAQRPEVGDRTGITLPELAEFLQSIGVRSALNLDGGSSSSLYVDGIMHYGRYDAERLPIQRPVKSVLLVRPFAESHSPDRSTDNSTE